MTADLRREPTQEEIDRFGEAAYHHSSCCGACDTCLHICWGYHGPDRRKVNDPLIPQWEERRGRAKGPSR